MGFVFMSHILHNEPVFFANSVKAKKYCRLKNEIFSAFNDVISINLKTKTIKYAQCALYKLSMSQCMRNNCAVCINTMQCATKTAVYLITCIHCNQ